MNDLSNALDHHGLSTQDLQINWKLGIEIELIAPPGQNRRHLAELVAKENQGTVRPIYFPDAEPSKVPGQKVFHSLTPGFEVVDAKQQLIARFVDDITIQTDLDREKKPQTDWYRIVSDDKRFLRLVELHCNPADPIDESLDPIAKIFGTKSEPCPGGMYRVADSSSFPIVMASGLPGERERPCEVVTTPFTKDHLQNLDRLLRAASKLGFSVPSEGAVHLHFDASDLCQAKVLYNLGAMLLPRRLMLRRLMQTNPKCRRLGPWAKEVIETVREDGFVELEWDKVKEKMPLLKVSKYCDLNIRNLLVPVPHKHTLEIRILPVSLEATPIIAAARLFETVLKRVMEAPPLSWPVQQTADNMDNYQAFFEEIQLSQNLQRYYFERMKQDGQQDSSVATTAESSKKPLTSSLTSSQK